MILRKGRVRCEQVGPEYACDVGGVLVDTAILRKAEHLIESCEACNEEGAEIPFDNILDRITGSDPSVTDYILEMPAKCPNCRHEILEKALVEPT